MPLEATCCHRVHRFVQLNARVVPPPVLQYGDTYVLPGDKGDWNLTGVRCADARWHVVCSLFERTTTSAPARRGRRPRCRRRLRLSNPASLDSYAVVVLANTKAHEDERFVQVRSPAAHLA